MNKSIVVLAVLAFAALAQADETRPPSPEETLVVSPASAHFKPVTAPGMPEGVQAALVAKDPASGGTVAYAKLPAGSHIPMHWHSHAEYSVVISGKAELTIDGKKHAVAAGSYAVIPAKAHHELRCADECVLLTRRPGPTDYNWVK